MILHSILPMEAVFPDDGQTAYEYRPCGNGYIQGKREADGGFTVSRLISTDPHAYLDPRLHPGGRLNM